MKKIKILLFVFLLLLAGCGKSNKSKILDNEFASCQGYTLEELMDNYFLEYEWTDDTELKGIVINNNKPTKVKLSFTVDDDIRISDTFLLNDMCKAIKNKDSGERLQKEVNVVGIYNSEVYKVELPEKANITIYGSEDAINYLKEDDNVYVTLDLTGLEGKENKVYYGIGIKDGANYKYGNVFIKVDPSFEIIDLEESVSKTITLEVNIEDDIKSKVINIDAPKEAIIKGLELNLNRVEKVVVTLNKDNIGDINNAVRDVNSVKAVDKKGKEVDNVEIVISGKINVVMVQ